MKQVQEIIVSTALNWVGEEEIAGNKGFKNKEFQRQMMEAGWQTGWSWCACFAEKIAIETYNMFPQFPEKRITMRQILTPSCITTFRNAQKHGLVIKHPEPGCFVVWDCGRGTGHIGIVEKVLDAKNIQTIEGNTNKAGEREGKYVMQKQRKSAIGGPKNFYLLGYIKPL